ARRVHDAPGFVGDPLRRRAWLGATWMGPARPTIDPAKAATADRAYLDMGATTRTRIVAERFGEDWEAVEARLADEAARRLADGVATPVHAAASTPAANPEDSE
ncbi:MAG: phage portal protein, partial [Pseudomonadota bacterium]|nr:phage portal protein [Pseudomonadota bacterium]